jgi:hypothetical protein
MEISGFGITLFYSELLCSVMVLQRFFVCVALMQCANGRLVEEASAQFIADYFAYKHIHVLATFTCSRHGTYTSMSSLYRI